jgi:hypothetical protein
VSKSCVVCIHSCVCGLYGDAGNVADDYPYMIENVVQFDAAMSTMLATVCQHFQPREGTPKEDVNRGDPEDAQGA